MELHLYSYPICPFVQRVAFTLAEKAVPYDVTYLELDDKPAWFLEKNPRGKVPALEVTVGEGPERRSAVLTESQAICELLDEAFPHPRLVPADPLDRARDRAWFAVSGDELVTPSHRLLLTPDAAVFRSTADALAAALRRLDEALAGRDWLSGDGTRFGLADVAVGPVFSRFALAERLGAWEVPRELENLAAWRARVTARPGFAASVAPQFEDELLSRMRRRGAVALGAT